MKIAIGTVFGAIALCAFASVAVAKPATGTDAKPAEVGAKGANGAAASSLQGAMGDHASDGKNSRD